MSFAVICGDSYIGGKIKDDDYFEGDPQLFFRSRIDHLSALPLLQQSPELTVNQQRFAECFTGME